MSNNQIKHPKLFAPLELKSILEIYKAKGFNVPIYQRLFSWTNKEVVKLLEDINNTLAKDSEKEYFIGNLTLNYNKTSEYYDIIDGQQRITTLWLIALVLQTEPGITNWQAFLKNDYGITLSFVAREEDNSFLTKLLNESEINDMQSLYGENTNSIMIDAIKSIKDFIRDNVINIELFSKYILRYVKMAVIFLPENIDLNKYFEDMNNRGLQLEPHHIVKALLLKEIDTSLQISCAKVWDAVSQMNQYVEYGFSETLQINRNKLTTNYNSYFDNDIEPPKTANNSVIKFETIQLLINEAIKSPYKRENDKTKGIDVEEKTTSIISFPEFLLHCLRLFKNDYTISVDDKKIAEVFEKEYSTIDALAFIKFLFKTRILFDKYIIKSVTTNDGTFWEIRQIENVNGEYVRKKHMEGPVIQIQSMFNVSTSTSVWLTKVLEFIQADNLMEDKFLEELEKIDKSINKEILINELSNGTGTYRYWFYKLDYLLWKLWSKENAIIPEIKEIDKLKNKIRNFQFRDNRSIEHIQPQNPDIETWVAMPDSNLETIKNQFGNLALISIRSNSSYNKQLPALKKDDFIKRSKNIGIESLKLLDAYKYEDWSIENMNLHQMEMIKILEEEYK